METKIYRGRLIDHLHLVVKDIEASYRFYNAILQELGIEVHKQDHFFYCDELFVSDITHSDMHANTGRVHLAFQAKDQDVVNRIHSMGIAAGGKDNGKPGERKYHPGYYACFWIDPDGNNIEVVHHGKAKKSSEAIEITF